MCIMDAEATNDTSAANEASALVLQVSPVTPVGVPSDTCPPCSQFCGTPTLATCLLQPQLS